MVGQNKYQAFRGEVDDVLFEYRSCFVDPFALLTSFEHGVSASYEINRERTIDFLNTQPSLFVIDCYANWDLNNRFKVT
jgi:hypothetical protein